MPHSAERIKLKCPISRNGMFRTHFLLISWNGQSGCPFHGMTKKCAISWNGLFHKRGVTYIPCILIIPWYILVWVFTYLVYLGGLYLTFFSMKFYTVNVRFWLSFKSEFAQKWSNFNEINHLGHFRYITNENVNWKNWQNRFCFFG